MDPTQKEILDRTRRIETRLTKLVKALGLDSGQLPVFDPDELQLHVPSRHVSLQDCLAAVPTGAQVAVTIKGELLGHIMRRD